MPTLQLPPDFALINFLTDVSSADAMYSVDKTHGGLDDVQAGLHYISVGLSALKIFEYAITEGFMPLSGLRSILDLPCGHGRVARILRSRFPDANLTVCDIDRDGVNFCVSRLGATGVYSCADFDKLDFGEQFDLIWVGSLITHLIASDTVKLIRCMERFLSHDGLLILTSNGEKIADRLASLDPVHPVLAQYNLTGYGASVDAYLKGYDHTIISRHWFEGLFAGEPFAIIAYLEHEWDTEQDVLFIKKRPVLPTEFDPKVYLTIHKDVADAGVDPVQHYLMFGRKEGRRLR
jgi:SAM-dependent methyltransferase